MKNPKGNKILTKEEIKELAFKEMDKIIKDMTPEEESIFLKKHYKLREVESWISKQLTRLEIRNSKIKT